MIRQREVIIYVVRRESHSREIGPISVAHVRNKWVRRDAVQLRRRQRRRRRRRGRGRRRRRRVHWSYSAPHHNTRTQLAKYVRSKPPASIAMQSNRVFVGAGPLIVDVEHAIGPHVLQSIESRRSRLLLEGRRCRVDESRMERLWLCWLLQRQRLLLLLLLESSRLTLGGLRRSRRNNRNNG
jgi:hypothetical protein